MVLTRNQFAVLEALATSVQKLTQRELQKHCGFSLGLINKTIKELTDLDLISNGSITNRGLDSLEGYRVKRAIFLAAGFGARLVPITLNTPKPMIKVNNVRIIDGLIDKVLSLGIEEIYVVRGYLSEQFDQLLYKYPFVKFLENPLYNESNNISSAMCARYLFSNAYVFESDLIINTPDILKKYHYTSDFLAVKKDRTDDWCFTVKDNKIVEEKLGGFFSWQMIGISYWNNEDGKKLSLDLEEVFSMPGGKEYFWEQVPLSVFKNKYQVEIKECKDNDVIEIDTFNELKKIDSSYDV